MRDSKLPDNSTDPEAFGWSYHKALVQYILHRIQHPDDAQDLAQEAHIRLFNKSLDLLNNPRAYLFRIARNLVADYYREKTSTLTAHTALSTHEAVELEKRLNSDPLQTQEEARQVTTDGLNTLPNLVRTVIELACRESLSVTEIAQRTGLSPFTIQKYRAMGKKKLQAHIKDL